MAKSFRALGWDEREHLAARLADVASARACLREAQAVPGGRRVYQLRLDLVVALEAYGTALADVGAPLPRQLRAEIALQRGIGHHS